MKLIKEEFGLRIYECSNYFDKLFGLMFKKNIEYGILIKNCRSIHTFFMRKKIDVLFLDMDEQIISVRYNVPAWRVLGEKKARHVLELPTGYYNNEKKLSE